MGNIGEKNIPWNSSTHPSPPHSVSQADCLITILTICTRNLWVFALYLPWLWARMGVIDLRRANSYSSYPGTEKQTLPHKSAAILSAVCAYKVIPLHMHLIK